MVNEYQKVAVDKFNKFCNSFLQNPIKSCSAEKAKEYSDIVDRYWHILIKCVSEGKGCVPLYSILTPEATLFLSHAIFLVYEKHQKVRLSRLGENIELWVERSRNITKQDNWLKASGIIIKITQNTFISANPVLVESTLRLLHLYAGQYLAFNERIKEKRWLENLANARFNAA